VHGSVGNKSICFRADDIYHRRTPHEPFSQLKFGPLHLAVWAGRCCLNIFESLDVAVVPDLLDIVQGINDIVNNPVGSPPIAEQPTGGTDILKSGLSYHASRKNRGVESW